MIAIAGSLVGMIGVIWIAVIAFQNDDIAWGVISLFCGIVAIIYGVQHLDEAKIPLGLILIGIVVGTAGRMMALQT